MAPIISLSSQSVYISSVLHLYASSAMAFLLLLCAKSRFSKPVDLSTPSHLYPGFVPKRLGGGGGPLYSGYCLMPDEATAFLRLFCMYASIGSSSLSAPYQIIKMQGQPKSNYGMFM